MSETQASLIWCAVAAYLALGFAVALAMLFGGLRRIDPLAQAAPWRVKLLLAPGVIALWPVLAVKALRGPGERT